MAGLIMPSIVGAENAFNAMQDFYGRTLMPGVCSTSLVHPWRFLCQHRGQRGSVFMAMQEDFLPSDRDISGRLGGQIQAANVAPLILRCTNISGRGREGAGRRSRCRPPVVVLMSGGNRHGWHQHGSAGPDHRQTRQPAQALDADGVIRELSAQAVYRFPALNVFLTNPPSIRIGARSRPFCTVLQYTMQGNRDLRISS